MFFSSLTSSMSLTTKYVEPRWSEKKQQIQRKQWKRRIIGYHYHLTFSQATWFKDDVPLLGALDFDEKYAFIAFCQHYKKYFELLLFSTAEKGLVYIWILYFSFGKRFHRNRHLFKHWTQHIFDCHVLLVAIALLWYHYKWLKYCFCLQFC